MELVTVTSLMSASIADAIVTHSDEALRTWTPVLGIMRSKLTRAIDRLHRHDVAIVEREKVAIRLVLPPPGQTRPTNTESATLTVTEAAVLLGISRATAYVAVNAGEIPSIRMGRRVIIPRHAFMQMLDGHWPPPNAPV